MTVVDTTGPQKSVRGISFPWKRPARGPGGKFVGPMVTIEAYDDGWDDGASFLV